MLASARESIWVHFKNDMRPDRLGDERSHGETNKTQRNAIIQIRMGREYRGRRDEEKKQRKEQFAVNFFGINRNQMAHRMSGAMVKVLRDPLL